MNADRLEAICSRLKGTTTDVKWGNDLCYLVGGKMYCVTGLSGSFTASFKATPEDFSILIERDGIAPAPYVGRYHWVLVARPAALTAAEWKKYVEKSYQLVRGNLPAKLKKGL